MSDVAKCQNTKCAHKENCYRFKESKGEPISFENICNDENSYQWLMEINKDMEVQKKCEKDI
jgi:hypothetical protein